MPGMSGIQLADAATARWPSLRVILISGYASTISIGRPFLREPFRFSELSRIVRSEPQITEITSARRGTGGRFVVCGGGSMPGWKRKPHAAGPADDRACAARHEVMLLLRKRPELWPLLDALSLGERVDWPHVLGIY